MPIEPGITQPDIFSLLQIGWDLDVALQRQWMNAGITIGADGNDLMWTGIIPDPDNDDNQTGGDAAIVWGDNISPAAFGPDNLRFIFINDLSGAAEGPSSDQGRETMRITPEGNVGIGDKYTNTIPPPRRLSVHKSGLRPQFRISHSISPNIDNGRHADFQIDNDGFLFIRPSEANTTRAVAIGFLDSQQSDPTFETRLDVGGLTRIRNLPDSLKDCLIIGTNASENSADNYLTRLDFTGNPDEFLAGDGTWQTMTGGGGLDCRWQDINSITGVGANDISVGFDPQDPCYRQNVVIGAVGAKSKLAVQAETMRDNSPVGVLFDITDSQLGFDPSDNSGLVSALITDASGVNTNFGTSYCGIQSKGRFGRDAVGVDALAQQGLIHSIGVYSRASGSNEPIGVYAETPGPGHSFYGVGGNPTFTGTVINISDESIKTEITDLMEATEILQQLSPKSYYFVSPENRTIGFDQNLQYGLLAQEVQEVLPDIVREVTIPEARDSLGGFIEGTSVDLLGIQYTELIPIIIAGFQEQNAEMSAVMQENEALESELAELTQQLSQQVSLMEEQANQMEALQEQMNNVMTSLQASQSKMNNCCGTPQVKKQSETGMIELEQNFPNPFSDVTTINYSTSYPAQIRLDISDSQGRVLEVLVNQRQDAGEYRVEWDASEFAPGTYYYSLYADTELLTKKMIKK